MARLETWRGELDKTAKPEDAYSSAGESSVILSRERFVPKDGVLIKTKDEPDDKA
jgi:hypothetical protein